MSQDFDTEELEKLPPAQRLAKIKALKQELQNKIEQEAKELEEDSKHDMVEEQRQMDVLLHHHLEEDQSSHEISKQGQLEETVKNTPVEETNNQIDYSAPPNSEYVSSQHKMEDTLFSKDIRGKKLKDDSIYERNKTYN